MKPAVDPNPLISAVDQFLVDLELKIDSDALVYAWLIDLAHSQVIPRGYDPNLSGISGKLVPSSPLLKATKTFQKISNVGVTQKVLKEWQEETNCQYLGIFEVTAEKYQLAVLTEKKPQIPEVLDKEIKQLAKLLVSLESPALAISERLKELTPREREVCDLLVQGFGNQEIADELDISVARVKQALSSVYARLNVANRNELIKLLS